MAGRKRKIAQIPPEGYDPRYWQDYIQQERGKGEKSIWYGRYLLYRGLMESRNIKSAFELEQVEKKRRGLPVAKTMTGWYEHFTWFNWERRAADWDSSQEALEDAKTALARKELRKGEVEVASKLRDRAIEILNMPLTKKIIEKVELDSQGRPIAQYITIQPVRATMGDAVKMMEMYSKLTRLGLDMNTEKSEVTINQKATEREASLWDTVASDPQLADLAFDFLAKVQERQRLATPSNNPQLPEAASFRTIEEDDDD